MTQLNETHDPGLKSWVAAANRAGTDFPIQNLPFGIFATDSGAGPTGGVAIGDQILDLAQVVAMDLFDGPAQQAAAAASGPTLNPLMALGQDHWSALRRRLSELLRQGGPADILEAALVPMAAARMSVPARIGDFTDFFTSVNHATNMGNMNRPDNPLLPNFKYVPIAYHGRSSSIRVSGTSTRRPLGQIKSPDQAAPVFAPARRLDYETELGIYIGPGNNLGEPFPMAEAEDHVFGVGILNDWSTRDVQAWEYQPLGPFLAKNFSSIISPWIVMTEALAPFRTNAFRRPAGDPAPLAYLTAPGHDAAGGLDIQFETSILTAKMRQDGQAPQIIGTPNFKDQYWTMAQMVAHHVSNGCDLRPGDCLGSGTISGAERDQLGSLTEANYGGKQALEFANGESRMFLEDGDEVIMRAWCEHDGAVRIGLGECRSVIEPAP